MSQSEALAPPSGESQEPGTVRMGLVQKQRAAAKKIIIGTGLEPTCLAFHFHLVGSSNSPFWLKQEHTSERAPAPSLFGTYRYRSPPSGMVGEGTRRGSAVKTGRIIYLLGNTKGIQDSHFTAGNRAPERKGRSPKVKGQAKVRAGLRHIPPRPPPPHAASAGPLALLTGTSFSL